MWGLSASFSPDAPALEHGDGQARAAAREMLARRDIDLGDDWRELAAAQAPLGLQDRFVWTEGGPDAYRELLGQYLPTPRRTVRYARFEGDIAERAEEYLVFVGPDGEAQRMVHALPEGRPGAELEEHEARAIALSAVIARHGLTSGALEEVSADPSQLPSRRDWSFVFRDLENYPLDTGEARISVRIAGDEVVDTGRFVHIPEDWERDHRKERSVAQVVQIACVVLLVLLFVAGAVLAVVRWSRGRFARTTFLTFFLLLAGLGIVQLANGFRPITSQFDTTQPWQLQVGIVLVGGLIATLAVAGVTALLVGLAHRWLPPQPADDRRSSLAAGLGLGAALAGLAAAAGSLAPSTMPDWQSFTGAADTVPAVAAALAPFDAWLSAAALALFMVAVLEALTAGWRRLRAVGAAALLAFGLVVAGSGSVESLALWLAEGLGTGLVLLAAWVLVIRHQPAIVPLVVAAGAVLGALQRAAVNPFPGAAVGSIVGAAAILVVAVWWFGRITTDTKQPNEKPAGVADGDPAPAVEV